MSNLGVLLVYLWANPYLCPRNDGLSLQHQPMLQALQTLGWKVVRDGIGWLLRYSIITKATSIHPRWRFLFAPIILWLHDAWLFTCVFGVVALQVCPGLVPVAADIAEVVALLLSLVDCTDSMLCTFWRFFSPLCTKLGMYLHTQSEAKEDN